MGEIGDNLPGLEAFDKAGLVEDGGVAWRATVYRYFPHPRLAHVGDREEAAGSANSSGGTGEKR